MKHSIYIISLMLVPVWILAQSSTQNYVLTKTYQDANASSSIDVIQYFDGLGRPVETVQKGVTPTGGDLVSLVEYDVAGRQYRNWLPFVFGGTPGAYVTPTAITQGSPRSYYNYDNKPYATTEYENSPLSRVTGQYGTGTDWYANSKKKSIAFHTNVSNEVPYYFVGSTKQLQRNGYFDANTLYKTVTTDEDSKPTTEYKDKLGRVVMTQSSTDVRTCYVYNDLGQLSYVLPPIATDSLPTSGVIDDNHGVLKRYAYVYKYDERDNQSMKRLPGCDSICMVYDKADRLVLSQDGNQRQKNKWTVTKYDVFGRVLYTGIMTRNNSRTQLKTEINGKVLTESFNGTTGFYNTGYSNNYFSGEITPLVVNYYDNYNFRKMQTAIDSLKLIYSSLTGYDAMYSFGKANGLLTGTRTYILDKTGNYLVTALYYDDKGQVVQTRSNNQAGGYDIVYNHYDFAGRLRGNRKEHNTSFQTMLPEVYTYDYDNAGRPTTTYYQYSTKPTVLLCSKYYDELGRLTTNFRHNTTDTVSYTYNIRNWVSSIKSGGFKEELFYNTSNLCSTTTPCYNGNIAASTWLYNGVKKAYVYNYDQLNRLRLATGYQTSGCTLYAPNNREQFDFDKQGNVQRLWRDKDYSGIDFLQMTYNGNQVKAISDAYTNLNLSSVKEYNNGANQTTEFLYDKNGNMIKDYDRNIVTIRYNLLNLPDSIQFANGNQIINRYAADGRKLGTEYFTRVVSTVIPMDKDSVCNWTYQSGVTNQSGTIYIGNIEYQTLNGSPYNLFYMKFKNPEGYSNKFLMYYNRYDHLGNVREVWQAGTSTNSAYQRTQYYPSGLPWASNTSDYPGHQPYKYNNKEFVEMHGYDTYDYGARGYYPAADFIPTVDPLAELTPSISPYAYCKGNPVNMIDPTGMYSTKEWMDDHGLTDNDVTTIYKAPSENKDDNIKKPDLLENLKNDFLSYFGWGLNPDDPKDRKKLDEGSKNRVKAAEKIDEANRFLIIQGTLFFVGEGAAYCIEEVGGTILVRIVGKEAVQAAEEGTNVVYLSVENKVTQYVGITGDFARRAAQHADRFIINPLIKNISRYDARSVEQALIEIHKLGKNGGTLLNKINSIATSNPIYKQSLERGYQILKSIGYEF
ncbi:MAG: DUF6443 domain-containing protein [Paludibacter sp.]|nr:DUF6443 domain-containing protein [Paludibacter sp.]